MLKKCMVITALAAGSALAALPISLSDARKIGKQIWKNECAGTIEGLTSWNEGEEFASLGIGHFIWCPAGHKKSCPFSETFPSLLDFIKKNGRSLPTWLSPYMACVWKTRKEFLAAFNSSRMKELREFLSQTIDLQTEFIIQRVETALPSMIKRAPTKLHAHIKKQFSLLEQTPAGMYALIDYINFKGEGLSQKERYKNKGWGLLQVLEHMHAKTSNEAVYEFATAAKILLTERVKNAPPERKEDRWLPGWKNRIDTYLKFS